MIEWDEEGLDRLLAQGIEGPIYMLNLLRFRPDGGEEKYFSYLTETNFARDEYGAELIYWGRGGDPLVMDDCGKKWDAAGFVRYPSVQTLDSRRGNICDTRRWSIRCCSPPLRWATVEASVASQSLVLVDWTRQRQAWPALAGCWPRPGSSGARAGTSGDGVDCLPISRGNQVSSRRWRDCAASSESRGARPEGRHRR
jgi:hypothetical protein